MISKELELLRDHFKNNSLIEIITLAYKIYPDMSLSKEAFEELKSIKDKEHK